MKKIQLQEHEFVRAVTCGRSEDGAHCWIEVHIEHSETGVHRRVPFFGRDMTPDMAAIFPVCLAAQRALEAAADRFVR